MIEPGLVDHPVFMPCRCMICGGTEGAMVDTRVDIVGDGRMYVCVRTCLPVIARLAGYLPPEDARLLNERVGIAEDRADALAGIVERQRKIVSLLTAEPFDPASLEIPTGDNQPWPNDRCQETRKDGSPCEGKPLPGYPTCVAHTRKPVAA